MNLHVVAYPQLSQADYELIQACRKEYNSLYSIIEPHFTLVFSVQDIEAADFIGEVRKRGAGFGPIEFTFRCAIITPDVISGYYDAFLVPDEGFSKVVRLHDSLYSGLLAPHHRLDIAYTPHLSIAASPDVHKIKKIIDSWNEKEFAIKGTISTLDIINYENRVISTIERVVL